MHRLLLSCVVLGACSVSDPGDERPAPLPPLPMPAQADTDRFRDAEACAQCHLVADDTPVLHDATGANVSPVLLWRASMMGLAARDPYYLAVFQEEIAREPERKDEIEKLCTRCHAPAGSEELANQGAHLSFDELTSGDSPAARLGRGGVTCSLCHQIAANGLGSDQTFTGKFSVGYQRQIFGPYNNPLTEPMMLIVNYTPTYGSHITSSELCATCHTVIIPTPSGEVVEQATFLEWRSSSYAPDRTCQSCHVPPVDNQGMAISTPVASFPEDLAPRNPVGRHELVGGNAYMLRLIADAIEWSGAGIAASELMASADRSEAHLRTAAHLTIRETRREGDTLVVTVRVENKTGHKLPTGYPSRRVWLHLTVTAGGSVVFESGAPDALPAAEIHRDTITSPDQVQIWEATFVDVAGKPTHRALDARRYNKDNRILPEGFAPTGSDRTRTEPLGTTGDASFVPGSDEVTYRIAGVPAGATVDVELLYQSLRPETVDAIEKAKTPAGSRFVDLVRARPITSSVMATASQTVQ